jgi:hypothetical protein
VRGESEWKRRKETPTKQGIRENRQNKQNEDKKQNEQNEEHRQTAANPAQIIAI